jgi:cytosine deaminase
MTLLRQATLADGSTVDVRIDGPNIDAMAPAGTLRPMAEEDVLQLGGYLLLPSPVEPHAHLDKAFTAGRMPNLPGDLPGAIAMYLEFRAGVDTDDILERARHGARQSVAFGATAIRTHVDVGEGVGLRGLEALIRLREELAGVIPVQIAALVSRPVTGLAGSENRAILRAAMERGADLVGGAPHVDPSPKEALEFCMQTASELARPVDLHMDETLDESMLGLADLAAMANEFPHPVTASHCVSLGIQPAAVQKRVAEALATAGVSVVTLPQTNLYLQGRGWETSPPRALTAVRALLDAGVTVGGGSDNVQDVFNPVGRGDQVENACLLVTAAHLSPQTAYSLVSDGARGVMGMPASNIRAGDPADLMAIAAHSLTEALASVTEDRIVFAGGTVVARTSVERTMVPASLATEAVGAAPLGSSPGTGGTAWQ